MSKRLPALIEPLRLAEKSSLLEGQLPLSQMKRLTPVLFVGKGVEDKGELAISLQFDIDESRQANIQGRINGEITLVCQRCMQGMTYKIDTTVSLAIVRNDAQAVKLPSHYEPLILDESPMQPDWTMPASRVRSDVLDRSVKHDVRPVTDFCQSRKIR